MYSVVLRGELFRQGPMATRNTRDGDWGEQIEALRSIRANVIGDLPNVVV